MNLNKGFTLIELLVVISIIGLFSSIVLAGLNSARDKAKDAKIMQEVRQLATLHALEFSEKNTYSNFNRGAWRNTTGVGSGYRLCTGETSVDTTVSPFVSSASNFANQGIDLCKSIVNTVGSVRNDILYNGVNGTNWDSTKVWSIMAYLPGKNGFFVLVVVAEQASVFLQLLRILIFHLEQKEPKRQGLFPLFGQVQDAMEILRCEYIC
ncbi:MAG: prepilin-type N-terminal cleavage/methylation domain-containing protein [Candidatus Taylorbacteria bacterium]|nr:prepilin-type N-terminal cleavage/methylation domain-containing protein [Candidatus Taylorbacteria bacterium]